MPGPGNADRPGAGPPDAPPAGARSTGMVDITARNGRLTWEYAGRSDV
jgi:hypothetical protein